MASVMQGPTWHPLAISGSFFGLTIRALASLVSEKGLDEGGLPLTRGESVAITLQRQ